MIHSPTEKELNYMLELIGGVSLFEDEETDIEEGISFTKSSWDDELLDYLVPGCQKKSVLNQETMKKLVVQKQNNARKLTAQKEAQREARKASNTVVVPVTVHQAQNGKIGLPR